MTWQHADAFFIYVGIHRSIETHVFNCNMTRSGGAQSQKDHDPLNDMNQSKR